MDKYETFGRRVGAAILDSFVLFPVGLGISFVFLLIGDAAPLLGSAAAGLVSAIYYIFMHYRFGQTVGKMAARVKVLDDSENPINFGQAIIRSLPQLLAPMFAVSFSTAGEPPDGDSGGFWASMIYGLTALFSVANVIVCLANEKRRALHDFIAGTIVVRTDI
jgi:uncharacterized RDD family membrane protein YckC